VLLLVSFSGAQMPCGFIDATNEAPVSSKKLSFPLGETQSVSLASHKFSHATIHKSFIVLNKYKIILVNI
jgi:hypothetical protein